MPQAKEPDSCGIGSGSTLVIHLLDGCNLQCRHCYMDAGTARATRLPLGLVERSLGEVGLLGVRAVHFSGGEPFLHPEFAEVLHHAARQAVPELSVSTNGTLIGPREAALLRETGTAAHVSIDGPEAYHDQMRGLAGAFQASSRAIRNLVDAGVPVSIVMTVCQDNLSCLPWLAEWALGMGVDMMVVQPLLQLGRGAALAAQKLTPEQAAGLYVQLSDLGYAYRGRGLRFLLAGYRTRALLLAHPCAAYVCNGLTCHRQVIKEIKTLIVREDGTVLPESATLHPHYALGNLRDGTLLELAEHYFVDGYREFDRLCRGIYAEIIADHGSPLLPWNEMLSERSWESAVEACAASPDHAA